MSRSLPRVGGTMTVAEWCIFGARAALSADDRAVQMDRLRAASTTRKPRDPAFYEDPLARARARRPPQRHRDLSVLRRRRAACRISRGPQRLINELAVLFLIVRIAYVFTYLGNRPTLRSILWNIGFAINLAIFFLPVIKGGCRRSTPAWLRSASSRVSNHERPPSFETRPTTPLLRMRITDTSPARRRDSRTAGPAPNSSTRPAAPNSMPRMISTPPPSRPARQPLRQALGRDRDDGDGRDRDRGAEPHHEGRGDAGPEQALRQREHQHQDRARTGPDADGDDRAKAAPPAAGAGELIRRRAVGMAAMLVMDMVVAMIVVVMVMVVMIVAVMMMVVMMVMRRRRSPCAGAARGACSARMKPPPLVQTSRAPNAAIRPSLRSRSPSPRRTWSCAVTFSSQAPMPTISDRDQRLQQRRDERQHDAAPGGLLVGDEIGGDHRLAVAGAGGVKDAVGKGDRQQRPHRRAVGLRGADGRWTSRDRIRTAWPAASRRCRRPGARRLARRRRTDSAPAAHG